MADVYLFNFRAVLVFTAIHEDVLPLRMTVEVTINLQNTFLDGYGKFYYTAGKGKGLHFASS